MNEKEMFLDTWQREFATTLKILKQLPPDKAKFKPPADKTKSAMDLATMFIGELGVIGMVLKGKIEFGGPPPSFENYQDLLSAYESTFRSMVPKVQGMSEAEWNSMITAPIGPKRIGEVRKADMMWLMLMDSVHHRGQFSVYLRLIGAKVPSIYGPSGDEPWS